MRQKKETLILTFHTPTQAIAVEQFCEKHGLPGRLIPVPREITAGCGLAWKAMPEDREPLQTALSQDGLAWEGTYILMI